MNVAACVPCAPGLQALVEGDEEEGGSRPAKRWPFDWRKPHLTVFRRESYQ